VIFFLIIGVIYLQDNNNKESLNDNEKINIGLVEDFEIFSELNKNDKVSITYTKHKEDFLRPVKWLRTLQISV
jgi:hypothetical protein